VCLAVLLIHAALLPLLFYGLLTVARNNLEEVFTDHIRSYTRMFADLFERSLPNATESEIMSNLDSSILGGRCVYAALTIGESSYLSSLIGADEAEEFKEDFAFGEHGDHVYYLATPLEFPGNTGVLRLGFDEESTVAQIRNAQQTILYVLGIYLFGSLLLAILLSGYITRPLGRLRRDSRMIASGDYTRQLTVSSEIQEFRDLADDLEAMRSELVGVNARLTEEMSERAAAQAEQRQIEAQLRHVQRLQSIGTLAGGIAHEFNNILLPVLLYTELSLEDLPPESPIRPRLERVMKLANRARGLSQQILTFGRRSSDTTRKVQDIASVVEEAMSLVRALIPASIDIHSRIDPDIGQVNCDASEIQQLVVNLCSNAYLALGVGGGRVAVSLSRYAVTREFASEHPRLREGPYVRLAVEDTGEGMDSATMDRIFEPFFTTREIGKGSGMGLSVVHGIVVQHDGEIVVASKPNEGTRISIYFPSAAGQEVSIAAGQRQ
jgi:signal transduction histidine kinase